MARDWQQLIELAIPLARAMQVHIAVQADQTLRLTAPLAPNVNDKGTAFGGSVATLATIAGWAEVQRQLDLARIDEAIDIVIQRGATEYLLPVDGDFSAIAQLIDVSASERFVRTFMRRNLGRLTVKVDILCNGSPRARFEADYVAIRPVA
jgi:thioesterase domain-containing protein